MIQAKRDKLNIKKLNPPGVFKKNKGKRALGEKFDSKFYPENYKNNVLYMDYNDLLDNLYMESKGIDYGLRCYKDYNKNKANKKKNILVSELPDTNNNSNKRLDKEDDNKLKKYVNNQFTFKQNYENNLDANQNININQDENLEQNNYDNNQENNILEDENKKNIIENINNNNFEQTSDINKENNNINENYEYQDFRLNYVMTKLGLESLIPIFEQYHMSFNDILFLSKEDLEEIGLKIFQKNRLISFIEEYSAQAKNYSLEEIETFFEENKIFNITNDKE